ncbi:unnamed protein product [Symbiodinium natans]|uniref:Uncharacterized protein n=1 Tax=Symbiodinium natans TaxID=878477 RepID=A0A812RC73_9DINO|nr:unnamed protein product [Symbiodinium natans]
MASFRMRTPSPSPMVSRSGHVSRVVSPARSAGPPLYLRTKRDPLVVSVITIPGHPAPPVYAARLPPAMPVRQCPPFATPRRVRPGHREMGAASSPALQTPPKVTRPSPSASHEFSTSRPLPNLLQRRKPDMEEPPDYGSPKAGPETRELQAMQQEHEAGEKEQQMQLQDEAEPAVREHALQEQRLHFEQRLQEKADAHEQTCKALQLEHEQALKEEKELREHALEEQRLHFEQRLQEKADAQEQTCKAMQLEHEQALKAEEARREHALEEQNLHYQGILQEMRLEYDQAMEAEKALRERVLQEQRLNFEKLLQDQSLHVQRLLQEIGDAHEQTRKAMRLEYEQALEAEKALRERALQEQQLNFEQLLKDARKQTMEDVVPRQPAASEHRDTPQEAAAVSPPPQGQPLPAQEAAAFSPAPRAQPLPAQARASEEEQAAHFKEALACYHQRYGKIPDASQLATFSANMGFRVPFKLAKELLWARRRR